MSTPHFPTRAAKRKLQFPSTMAERRWKDEDMAEIVFKHQHRIIYAECTVGNHVYYARYLDMLEEARGEFFRQAGWPLLALAGERARPFRSSARGSISKGRRAMMMW